MGLFDKLESKLEQGVNGAFARAFKAEVQPVEIASGIRRAMDDSAASTKKGKRPIVPNLFTIELSPTDYERLTSWGDELDDELIASAQEHCDEQRYLPGGPLTIVLSESHDLETGVFRLRPATAKAADALAHSRNFPRPAPKPSADERFVSSDEQDEYDDAPGRHGAHVLDVDSADDRDDVSPSERGLGARIKGYLRGDPSPVSHDSYRDDHTGTHDDRYDEYDDEQTDDEYDIDDVEYDEAPSSASRERPYRDTDDRAVRSHDVEEDFDDHAGIASYDHARNPRQVVTPRTKTGTAVAPLPHRAPRPATHDEDDTDAGDATAHFVPDPAPARPRALTPRERPWLKIDGQRYPLLGAITTLGRDDDADIVIDDPGVSRRHSEIRITHDGPHLVMSIRDLDSTNGTFVNGDRTSSQHLRDGDRITVGRTHMTIHLGDRP